MRISDWSSDVCSSDLIGTLATVLQLLKLPDGTVKVLVEGRQRAQIDSIDVSGEYLKADISLIDEQEASGTQVQALMRSVAEQFEQYVRLNKKIAPDIPVQVGQIEEPSRLADAVAAHLSLKVSDKQTLLSAFDPQQRLEMVLAFMEGVMGVLTED